jgi:hypothetical protein
MDLIRKLEKRFGFRELPETAQVQFNNARQTPDELLEDWADRVLSLATRAFRDLPETHVYQQAVVRLCQGASDKEASLRWMILGVSCSLPRVCLVLPLLSLIKGLVCSFLHPLRCSSEGNDDHPFPAKRFLYETGL